jgi:hypothetical protein
VVKKWLLTHPRRGIGKNGKFPGACPGVNTLDFKCRTIAQLVKNQYYEADKFAHPFMGGFQSLPLCPGAERKGPDETGPAGLDMQKEFMPMMSWGNTEIKVKRK